MKKLLIILTLCLVSCSSSTEPCRPCDGKATEVIEAIKFYYQKIARNPTYSEYIGELNDAENCMNVVCDGKRWCYKHEHWVNNFGKR